MLRMFFFSGTGNARNVARWVVQSWRERSQEAETIDIAQGNVHTVQVGPDDVIGLVSPTHGFNFPPITLAFLFAFPRTPYRNRVFILNTRAGVRFFGICFPGLSGAAQLLAAVVFMFKGYRVVGMRGIDLPSNWISVHPGLREANIQAIYKRCEATTRRFAQRLLDGHRDLRALFDLPQDLVITPISLTYYFVGRFIFAKSFVASAACDACGLCIKQCPVQAIQLVNSRPFWTYKCESCMRCMNHCPKRAIETAHGFVTAVLVLVSIVLKPLAHSTLGNWVPLGATTGALARSVHFIVNPLVTLSVLFLSYRLMHWAARFRVIRRLVAWTSLTHYTFWRRYRGPTIAYSAQPSRVNIDEGTAGDSVAKPR